jgi:DNA-binding beta-propeller fold protein YncE
MKKWAYLMTSCIVFLFFLSSAAVGQDSAVLSLKTKIAVPGINGRMDHFSVDLKGQRLFVSALGNNTVEIFDLKAGKRVRTITGLDAPQGLFFDPSTNHLLVASEDGSVKIYDATSFQLLRTVKLKDDADNIRYDARNHTVMVGYGGGKEIRNRPLSPGVIAVMDTDGNPVGEIVTDSHPESFQLEKSGARVFVNVPDKKEVEVADLTTRTVTDRWPIADAQNFPMALDESHHRLFVGCRVPAQLLVLDTTNGKTVASMDIVGQTDDLFYDAQKSRIYVIGGRGFIDVFQQKDPDHYERIARNPVPLNTRTGIFVPEWGELLAAVAHGDKQEAEILVYETK